MSYLKNMSSTAVGLVLLSSWSMAQSIEWPKSQGGNGHHYEAVLRPAGLSWIQASQEAVLAGGHLATITSSQENLFVFQLVTDPSFWIQVGDSRGPWLGGVWDSTIGWTWVNGELMTFANWAAGEPNGNQNTPWIHFMGKGAGLTIASTWNDLGGVPGEYPRGYIIEYDNINCNTATQVFGTGTAGCQGPHTLSSIGCPLIGNAGFGFQSTACPPSALGLLIIGDVTNVSGTDLFGVNTPSYVDVFNSTELFGFDIVSNASGNAVAITSIPLNSSLVGLSFIGQCFWAWPVSGPNCFPPPIGSWNPPYGMSATPGLIITIQG